MSGATSRVRLLPALMVTMGVVLSLRAAAAAQDAQEAPKKNSAAADKPAGPPKPAQPQPAPSQAAEAAFAESAGLSAQEVAVLESLGARRKALEARERALDDRSALLTAAEGRIQQRIDELKKIEGAIEAMLGKLDEDEEARITGLVNVYSRMRAKDAAAIFDALDEEVLVAVARRLREPVLAEIMGQMQPVAARKLTRALAQAQKLPEEAKSLLSDAKAVVAKPPAAPAAAAAAAAKP